MTEKTMSMEECLDVADELIQAIRVEAYNRMTMGDAFVLHTTLINNHDWLRVVIAKFFDDLPDEED